MKKIPSLFMRNYDGDRRVRNEVVPGSEWVIAGEGTATRKWDGMAILLKGGEVFKRYDAKTGRTPPPDFVPAQPEPDKETGHWPGWVPAGDDLRLKEALERGEYALADGTYELCGPKVGTRHGANPEELTRHVLIKHGDYELPACPRDYEGIRIYLRAGPYIEGVVWHHPDGRMVKIKASDFPVVDQSEVKPC